jgi:hypothetical protein
MNRYSIATPLQCNTINMNNLNSSWFSSWFSSCLSSHQILVWGQTVRKPPEDRRRFQGKKVRDGIVASMPNSVIETF